MPEIAEQKKIMIREIARASTVIVFEEMLASSAYRRGRYDTVVHGNE